LETIQETVSTNTILQVCHYQIFTACMHVTMKENRASAISDVQFAIRFDSLTESIRYEKKFGNFDLRLRSRFYLTKLYSSEDSQRRLNFSLI